MQSAGESSVRSTMEKLLSTLDHIAHGTEDDFLALGSRLQAVYGESSALHGRILASIQVLAADGDEGLLKHIQGYVRQSEERTAKALEVVEDLKARLSATTDLLKKVASLGEELRQAGVFLRALGINTGIESSRASRIGVMFSVVARDSVTLAETINGLTDQLLEQAGEARAAQEKTLTRTLANLKEIRTFSQQACEGAAGAMEEINGLFTRMAGVVEEAAQLSRNITKDIGAVVMGIQFHDNLRQRLEHVNHALADVRDGLEEAAERKALGENSSDKACETFLVTELQCSQLEALRHELGQVFRTQTQAFATIAANIGQLTRTLSGISAGGAGGSDVFARLSGAVTSLATARSGSEKLCGAITQSAAEAMEVTTRLAGFVRETTRIASQVHLNALNSTIKAAKLGGIGRPLQVLSQSMAAVAKQVKGLAPLFMERMEQVQGLVRLDREGPEDGATPEEAARSFDMRAIFTAFEQFKKDTAAIIAEGERLGDSVAGERRRLSFFRDLEAEIAGQAAVLRDVAERARPSDEELARARAGDVSDSIAERYTMEKERAVHQQLVESGQTSAAVQPVPAGAVLLFEDEAPPPAASGLSDGEVLLFDQETYAPPAATALDTDVVLFDQEERPGQEDPAGDEEKEKKEFGENVELF